MVAAGLAATVKDCSLGGSGGAGGERVVPRGEYISEVVAALPALVAVTVLLHVGGETTRVLSLF